MRHYFTSTAFAVKLLCIGFVYLISISLCAAQETKQASAAELIDKLFSDEEEIWRPTVRTVARLEDKVVLTLAEEVRRKPRRSNRVRLVFENFTSAATKKELIALLDDKDERIVERAADALMKPGNSAAAPALTKAMKRVQDHYIQWSVARALWYVAPNDQSAEAILNVARKQEGQDKEALFGILDDPIGRGHMTEAERLNFLLNYKVPSIVGVPEALDIRLKPQKVYEQLLFDKDDRLFLEKHRSKVIDIMLVRLHDNGSQVAALLLGYFKESKALPDLQKWFIETDHSYRWEGAWDRLDYYNFPVHHCYEEAIKHITGKPLNEVIKLTDEQVTQLIEGYRQPKAYDDESKLYVLFRLKPDIARLEATRKFRSLREETTKETWEIDTDFFLLCYSMTSLLPKGLLLTEVRRLLGEPDEVRESSWFYDCGNSPIDNPYVLTITFDNGRLSQASYKRVRLED